MANVTFTPNHQPAPACYPSDVNKLLDLLTTGGGLAGTIPDTAGGGIYVGSSPPSSALTNKVWFKTDGAGRPLGIYMFYNGNWRKVYTGACLGEIRMCWWFEGFFDGTGRGIIGGDYDGWAICNGQNGTPNMEAYIPVGGARGENIGLTPGTWYTDLDGTWKNAGGAKGTSYINPRMLPALRTAFYGIITMAAGNAGFEPMPKTYPGASKEFDWPVTDAAGNEVDGAGQQPLPIPQYQALGFIMFVGYQ